MHIHLPGGLNACLCLKQLSRQERIKQLVCNQLVSEAPSETLAPSRKRNPASVAHSSRIRVSPSASNLLSKAQ
ncbi:MAG: hypothetical protein PVS2B2_01430 [Candidatus Acidiferrum sp.]